MATSLTLGSPLASLTHLYIYCLHTSLRGCLRAEGDSPIEHLAPGTLPSLQSRIEEEKYTDPGISTPRLIAFTSCPAIKGKQRLILKLKNKKEKSNVMMQILFPVEPERTKCRSTLLNPSRSKEDGQQDQPTGSSSLMFYSCSQHCPTLDCSVCAFPCLDFLFVLVSLRWGYSSKDLKERREEVVLERSNSRNKGPEQKHVRHSEEQQGVPCGCSRMRKER